jgi:hypothetical protein
MWVNEEALKHVVRWSIGTVKMKEHCMDIPPVNFDEVLFLLTYPSSRRKLKISNGYEHFTLDRSSYIVKLQNFYIGYVQYSPLIILKQTWSHFIADRPLIAHVEMNGSQFFWDIKHLSTRTLVKHPCRM